jgi:hypothetical protein
MANGASGKSQATSRLFSVQIAQLIVSIRTIWVRMDVVRMMNWPCWVVSELRSGLNGLIRFLPHRNAALAASARTGKTCCD